MNKNVKMKTNDYLEDLETLNGFHGLKPGNISAEVAEKLEKGPKNPFTNNTYSSKYKKILKERRKLPVSAERQKLLDLVHNNQIVLLDGETGSGKTTQIPQYLAYDKLPHLEGKMIACTQPRRVSAISIAKRVAKEMDVELGEEVGYNVRFDNNSNSNTFIKYMTDGMLFREATFDHLLNKYAAIILDEVHERSLHVDILMAILKGICQKRKDLSVIIMSATLEKERFKEYFEGAPILEVAGRTFPVEICYTEIRSRKYLKAAVHTVREIHLNEPEGDVLIFLTGEQEIDDAITLIEEESDKMTITHKKGPLKVLPLYSSLSQNDQRKIFEKVPPPRTPGGAPGRKIIVATNIAQTSLTIKGIVYVIDSGFEKQSMYNPRTRVKSLKVSRISKASANQRSGRAGRTKAGKAYRLYTEDEFDKEFREQSDPDILKSNLGSTVLQLLKFGVKDILEFGLMDCPSPDIVKDAFKLLTDLGAVDYSGNLTPTGDLMSCFPLDPQLSKMVIRSHQYDCSEEIISLAALLSVPRIFYRPRKKKKKADEAREQFIHPDGDHLTLLNVYQEYKDNHSSAKWCYENFLNQTSLELADEIRVQLKQIIKNQGLDIVEDDIDEEEYSINIRRAITEGFFTQVARLNGSGKYIIVKENLVVNLHRNCCLRSRPRFVLYNESIMEGGNFIRDCIEIEPKWLPENAIKYYSSSDLPEPLR